MRGNKITRKAFQYQIAFLDKIQHSNQFIVITCNLIVEKASVVRTLPRLVQKVHRSTLFCLQFANIFNLTKVGVNILLERFGISWLLQLSINIRFDLFMTTIHNKKAIKMSILQKLPS